MVKNQQKRSLLSKLLLVTASFENPIDLDYLENLSRQNNNALVLILQGNVFLLYSVILEKRLLQLSGIYEDLCKGLAFPKGFDSHNSFDDENSYLIDKFSSLVDSVQQVAIVRNKIHSCDLQQNAGQAFASILAIRNEISHIYYESLFVTGIEEGLYALDCDILFLAQKAKVEFGMIFFALKSVLEQTLTDRLTNKIVPAGIWGLSGCNQWFTEVFVMTYKEKLIAYLNNLSESDITSQNVASLAVIALPLLWNKGCFSRLKDCYLFKVIKDIDVGNPLAKSCFENSEFVSYCNSRLSDLSSLNTSRQGYSDVVFVIVKQAYVAGKHELTRKEHIILKLLSDSEKLKEFAVFFPLICKDVIEGRFSKAAKYILGHDELKSKLSETSYTVESFNFSPNDKRGNAVISFGEYSESSENQRKDNTELLLDAIINYVRSQIPPTEAKRAKESNGVDALCMSVVAQCDTSEVELKELDGVIGEELRNVGITSSLSSPIRVTALPNSSTTFFPRVNPTTESISASDKLRPRALALQKTIAPCADWLDARLKLITKLNRPIILMDGDNKIKENSCDYEMRGGLFWDEDVSRICKKQSELKRPIVVLVQDFDKDKMYDFLRDHGHEVCMVSSDGTDVLSQPDYKKLWCSLRIVPITKEEGIRKWQEDNADNSNVLLAHKDAEGVREWYIYGRKQDGSRVEQLRVNDQEFNQQLVSKGTTGNMEFCHDKKLITQTLIFLGLDAEKLIPPQMPLFFYCNDTESNIYEWWLKNLRGLLQDRLNKHIDITATGLSLLFDRYSENVSGIKAKVVRSYLRVFSTQKREEMVTHILEMIANPSLYLPSMEHNKGSKSERTTSSRCSLM